MNNGHILPNKDFLTTRTPFDPQMELAELAAFIRFNRTSGTVTIHCHQGGIRAITLTEETEAKTERSRQRMREILGVG